MGAEQPYNLKLLEEELGVGVEMARGSDAEIRWVDVVKVSGWVMDGESKKGMEMRRNARHIQQLMKAATGVEGRMKWSSVTTLKDFMQVALFDN
ncbi:UDP-glycosyltransferase 92A1 [Cinnamomum micranthum f. kanehirae]|uniref:UDP-glycosyltransferase 92A1 n=1 Tax=Cinnamomum micranthum f. kanehirae TaxID=337451 RepID=A0A443PE04_9MAGN|nr:UDP-glycosyltransferase 92A1 [Cinnamomum micranthum f. kanehirae]